MSGDGRQVAQGLADHPLHILAVPYSTRQVVEAFAGDIHEDDLFLHNDPYTGGTHLNDLLLLHPVFLDGELAMFAAIRCHWNDVGGMTPGSLSGRVNEIYQEGIRITPTKLADRGRMNQAFVDLMFNNMRGRAERLGDFNAMLGTGRKAAEHIERLFQRFGGAVLLDGVEELMKRSERILRARLGECADGEYFAEGYIESDGTNPDPLVVRLKLTIQGSDIVADFTGTSAQTNGPTNCGPAMALNAVGTIVKAFLDPKTPINHGSFVPIEVPEMSVGDLKGGANHIHVAGPDPRGQGTFIHYEWPAAGTGASSGTDGSNAVRSYNEGDFNSIQGVETVEGAFPLRVERCELREGCCGDGEFRGGFGLRREIRVLGETAMLSVLSDKNVIPPHGVDGGGNGAANRFTVKRDGKRIEPSSQPGKVSGFPLRHGDVVCEETSGGGGHGDALARDPARVLEDLADGYLTPAQVDLRYGVVLADDGAIDGAATAARRAELHAALVTVTLAAANEEMFDGPRREFVVSGEVARRIGVAAGELVEITAGRGAPLRAWARTIEGDGDELLIGPSAFAIVGAAIGETVEIRAVRRTPELT
jgi:N-methylhydantoinase B